MRQSDPSLVHPHHLENINYGSTCSTCRWGLPLWFTAVFRVNDGNNILKEQIEGIALGNNSQLWSKAANYS